MGFGGTSCGKPRASHGVPCEFPLRPIVVLGFSRAQCIYLEFKMKGWTEILWSSLLTKNAGEPEDINMAVENR